MLCKLVNFFSGVKTFQGDDKTSSVPNLQNIRKKNKTGNLTNITEHSMLIRNTLWKFSDILGVSGYS